MKQATLLHNFSGRIPGICQAAQSEVTDDDGVWRPGKIHGVTWRQLQHACLPTGLRVDSKQKAPIISGMFSGRGVLILLVSINRYLTDYNSSYKGSRIHSIPLTHHPPSLLQLPSSVVPPGIHPSCTCVVISGQGTYCINPTIPPLNLDLATSARASYPRHGTSPCPKCFSECGDRMA